MRLVRLVGLMLQFYVAGLVLLGIVTVAWLTMPILVSSPDVAGLWFAVVGFGVIVILMLALAHVARG